MGWITVPGLAGKVYVPDDEKTQKKHPCSGCFSCQWCDENRCRVCHGDSAPGNKRAFSCGSKIIPCPSPKTNEP